jgi:hypothetical protein
VAFTSMIDPTGGNSDHSEESFVINSDGSGLLQLTDCSSLSYYSYHQSISGDASIVAFQSNADLTGGNSDHSHEVFVINSDGTGVRQLTSDASYSSRNAQINGDGSVVAFQSAADLTGGNSDHGAEIFVINSDGTGLTQLTSDASYDSGYPSISGDASIVAFQSNADLTGGNSDHCLGVFVATMDSWAASDQSLPESLTWDESAAVSVEATNDGPITWDGTYALTAVDGPTATAVATDRWGLENVAITGVTVAPAGTYLFQFTVTAPPWTTLKYVPTVTFTTPGVADYLDCNWILGNPGLITTDIAAQATAVGRFSDIQPELPQPSSWARFWIEELAGRVPLVVGGYGDGTYRPSVQVARDAMAVYITRAMKLPTAAFEGRFDDVPQSQWAWPWVEALVRAGIVQGFTPTEYRPSVLVKRDAMAVFVARALIGGVNVPSGPAVGTFDDVPDYDPGPAHWAYDAVEYCVNYGIVGGYTPTEYRPNVVVNRGQMAVFVWRAFMMPTGVPVVLAGPAITAVNPGTATYYGWTSIDSGAQADPGYAYIAFDALRLDINLSQPTGPTNDWDVRFELRGPHSPTPFSTATLSSAQIIALWNARIATGDPYYVMSWDIPAALTTGDYTLVVLVEDDTGTMHEVARQPAFTITP